MRNGRAEAASRIWSMGDDGMLTAHFCHCETEKGQERENSDSFLEILNTELIRICTNYQILHATNEATNTQYLVAEQAVIVEKRTECAVLSCVRFLS